MAPDLVAGRRPSSAPWRAGAALSPLAAGAAAAPLVLLLCLLAHVGPMAAAVAPVTAPNTTNAVAPRPVPGVSLSASLAVLPATALSALSAGLLDNLKASFVKPFDLAQVSSWLTLVDPTDLAAAKVQAAEHAKVLRQNLASPLLTQQMFSHFTDLYGKTYATPTVQAAALSSFTLNLQTVAAINADTSLTYWASCNQYCNLDFATFKSNVLLNNEGTLPTPDALTTPPPDDAFSAAAAIGRGRRLLQTLPAFVDWDNAGYVTPVKNQGNCGSCWAFAATGAIESSYLLGGNGRPACMVGAPNFSEQQLVNCVNGAHGYGGSKGCKGGWSQDAINYVAKWWQVLESRMPYTATTGSCPLGADPIAPSGGSVSLKYNVYENHGLTDAQLRAIVADRPTVIYFCVNNAFQLYGGGVYTDNGCGTCTNHAMLLVGYSTDSSGGTWKIKNSWGTGWGNGGYAFVRRNANANGGKGPCGIHQNAFRATVVFDSKLGSQCPSPPSPPPPPRKPPPPPPPRKPPPPPSLTDYTPLDLICQRFPWKCQQQP